MMKGLMPVKSFEAELIRDFGSRAFVAGPELPSAAVDVSGVGVPASDCTKRLGSAATAQDHALMMATAQWLCDLHPQWSAFFTGTFRVHPGPVWVPRNMLRPGQTRIARKGRSKFLYSRGVSQVSALKAFRGFMLRGFVDCDYFAAVEPNPSSDGHHIHGLIWRCEELFRSSMWQKWFDRFGRARVEPVHSQGQVISYCAKYNVKRIFAPGSSNLTWDICIRSQPVVDSRGSDFASNTACEIQPFPSKAIPLLTCDNG
jgi:transposase